MPTRHLKRLVWSFCVDLSYTSGNFPCAFPFVASPPPPPISAMCQCIQHIWLNAIGQKKRAIFLFAGFLLSSLIFFFTTVERHICNVDIDLFNTWTIAAVDRTSAKPQVELCFLSSYYLKIHALLTSKEHTFCTYILRTCSTVFYRKWTHWSKCMISYVLYLFVILIFIIFLGK